MFAGRPEKTWSSFPVCFKQINQLLGRVLRPLYPPAGGGKIALGAHRNRIDFSDIAWPGRHADRLQQLSVGELPHPHRLVIRTGNCEPPGCIHRNGIDPRRVHAGIDDQHRLLVKRRHRGGGSLSHDRVLRFLHPGEIRPACGFELRLDRFARQLIVRPVMVVESRYRLRQRFEQLLDRAFQDVAHVEV